MKAFEIAAFIQNFMPLVGIVLAIVLGRFSHQRTRFILVFLIASLLVDVLVAEMGVFYLFGRYLGELFFVVIIIAFTWMIYGESNRKRSLLFFGLITLTLHLIIRWTFQPSNTTPNISTVADNIALIALCFRYFYHIYQTEADLKLKSDLTFWITCIVFFYAAGGFFISLMVDFITRNGGEYAYLWIVQSTVSILTYLSFSYLIWLIHKQEKRTLTRIT